MKKMKINMGFIGVMIVMTVSFLCSATVYADEETINIADVQQRESVGCELTSEEVVDSYGNHYPSGVLRLDCNNTGSTIASYDLKGGYSAFVGTVTVSNEVSSEDSMNLGIFVDGKRIFSVVGMTRRDEKRNFNIDLKGAGLLEIKASGTGSAYNRSIYLVDSHFVKSDEQAPYSELIRIEDAYKIDSSQYEKSTNLFCDSFGTLHDGYSEFVTFRWLGTASSYAMFNLNKNYSIFEGAFVASPNTPQNAVFSVKITCDERILFEEFEITKTTPQVGFSIDVNNVKVVKIEISQEVKSLYSMLYLVDNRLQRHQHTPGEWIIEKEATCTHEGRKTQSCTICEELLDTESIPMLDHTNTDVWEIYRDPTCAEEGEEVQYCSVCGNIVERRPIDKLAHTTSDSWTIVRQPTCAEEGIRQKKCSVCGEVVQEEKIGKLVHDFGEWMVVSGNIWDNPIVWERKCAVCGFVDRMERNDTVWLKPLVAVLAIVVIILLSVLALFSIYKLPFKLGSLKKLISKMRNR